MSILIFIIILAVLIFVHEFGHFIVAKRSGIRVDEFGFGFPPRLFGWKRGETTYSINLIPFGGFVKIYGENPEETAGLLPDDPERGRSFAHKNRWVQAAVLVAGVTFNLIFAWILVSLGFMLGLPSPLGSEQAGAVQNAKVVVTSVLPNSPAARGGLKPGDTLVSLKTGDKEITADDIIKVQNFISENDAHPIQISLLRGNETATLTSTPEDGIVAGKKAIGISMEMIGILKLPFFSALYEGLKTTGTVVQETAAGLFNFITGAFVGKSHLSEVSGPVGLVGIVSDAAQLGFVYLLALAAFISVNLAVINLIPFPALDGGRLLFVFIEGLIKRPINPRTVNILNSVGFVLLLLLMVVVTGSDILKLFR